MSSDVGFAIRMPNGRLWGEYGGLLSVYQYMSGPLPVGPYVFGSEVEARTALDQLRVAAARLGIPLSGVRLVHRALPASRLY